MTEIIDILCSFVVILAALSFLIAMSNLRFLDSLEGALSRTNAQKRLKPVSILVPARNEEENIEQCLRAVITQNYQSLEILVLDDQSTDRTAEIVQDIEQSDPRVRMISGAQLPSGWIGKNWACHQLSQEATGEFLLFIDADTILSEGVTRAAVMESINRGVDLLTVMPRRIAGCILEKLMFPFMDWASFCWMPMKYARNSRNPHLSATFGQFMLFKREAYQAIRGHASIRAISLEDFELGRVTKKLGLKWMLFEGVSCVQVLPYKGSIDALRGVSRSVFPALYHRLSVLVLLSVVLLALGFLPPLIVATRILSYPQEIEALAIATASICMIAIPWFIVCLKFNHSKLTVLFYPLAMALMVVVAFHSMAMYSLGLQNWKNRRIVKLRH